MLNYNFFISSLLETIKNPNFSIVVPGGCNGKCNFCFWNKSKTCNNYISRLKETLNNLPSQFYQLSLTGGEPTISPYFKKILEIIDNKKFKHIVLTTNGTNILEHINIIKNKIKYINISRHHYDDTINSNIFKTDTIPNKEELKIICNELKKNKIDITLSAVLTENLNNKNDIDNFILFAKEMRVNSVFFRKQHGDNIDKTNVEKVYSNYPYINESNCPVCRSDKQLIENVFVTWKASKKEPSNELGYIYELVFNENGKLTTDWEMKNEINVKYIKENSTLLLENCGDGGCGHPSDVSWDYKKYPKSPKSPKPKKKDQLIYIKQLIKGDLLFCYKSYKDKFIKNIKYEIIDNDSEDEYIYIKYMKKSKNIKFKMSYDTLVEHFDVYKTIKPENYYNTMFDVEWDEDI